MLKRSKYDRLHSDPLTSSSDFPRGPLSVRRPSFLKNILTSGASVHRPTSGLDLKAQTSLTADHQRTESRTSGEHPWNTKSSGCSCDTFCRSCVGDDQWMMVKKVFHHHIKYLGSVEVMHSMRALDLSTRTKLTRDSISRLCKRKSAIEAEQSEGNILNSILGRERFSGTSVILSVSSEGLTLISASTLKNLVHHSMSAVSFASGGGPDLSDYVAFVAKDTNNLRACHILECRPGRSKDVIHSISRAFESRLQQVLAHKPASHRTDPTRIWDLQSLEGSIWTRNKPKACCAHPEYYNVIPGKEWNASRETDMTLAPPSRPGSLYENCCILDATPATPADTQVSGIRSDDRPSETWRQTQIRDEIWFHGRLGRLRAESLLRCRGDFLVRESSSSSGQYVLSGRDAVTVQHLQLLDPNGQIRTQDRVFYDISHLLRFHMDTLTPIVSGGSELYLMKPVVQSCGLEHV